MRNTSEYAQFVQPTLSERSQVCDFDATGTLKCPTASSSKRSRGVEHFEDITIMKRMPDRSVPRPLTEDEIKNLNLRFPKYGNKQVADPTYKPTIFFGEEDRLKLAKSWSTWSDDLKNYQRSACEYINYLTTKDIQDKVEADQMAQKVKEVKEGTWEGSRRYQEGLKELKDGKSS